MSKPLTCWVRNQEVRQFKFKCNTFDHRSWLLPETHSTSKYDKISFILDLFQLQLVRTCCLAMVGREGEDEEELD